MTDETPTSVMGESRDGVVRLTVALPEADIARVVVMASERGTTKTQILREAINLKACVDPMLEDGGTLIVRYKGYSQKIEFVENS